MDDTTTIKGRLTAIAVGLVLLLVASEAILRLTMPHWREYFSGRFLEVIAVPDHGLVTMGRPGFDGYFAQNNGDFRVRIHINRFGLRNPEPIEKADGRIWVVGDSMTFGWGVEDDEIYTSVIERMLGARTYNVASPATDVCGYQALIARMPRHTRPKAVIVGLVLENDIKVYDCRKAAALVAGRPKPSGTSTNFELRRFLFKHTALYNFFAVSLKRVAFMRDGLTALGLIAKGHEYRRPMDLADIMPAVERTAAELTNLVAMLPPGTPMAVLIAPGRFEIRDGDPFYRELRLATATALVSRGIAVIDPFDAFKQIGFAPTHFAYDGHWSALGHELAARAVAAWLRTQGADK